MQVLHVLPTRASEYGGPVRIADALCTSLRAEGHIASTFPTGARRPSPSRRLAYSPGIRGLQELRAMVKQADLVHIHGLWTLPTSTAAICAQSLRRPFIFTAHGMLDHWSLQRSRTRKRIYAAFIERRNLAAAAAIHFNSEEERDEARSFGIPVPTFVLPNGIYLHELSDLPGRDALWRQYPTTRGKTVVLFLGRIHPKKGVLLLIDALAELTARLPDLHAIVAGPDEGGHLAAVRARVRHAKLEPYVTFTGAVEGEDKRRLLGAADLFVLPSHQEGDSVAVKEALGAGLPVVITYPCHFRQVAEAKAGLVVNPVVEEVKQAIEALAGDGRLRARMASNARQLIERDYRWEVIGAQMVRRYEHVLQQRRALAEAAQ